jgi:peptidylprolyl isomerase
MLRVTSRSLFVLSLCAALLSGCGSKPEPANTASPSPAPTATPNDMQKLPNGLEYKDLVIGSGAPAKFGRKVRLHYVGRTTDGLKFDSSDGKPAMEIVLGKGEVIKGWELGIGGGNGLEPMRVGGKRKLIIPPALGYGDKPIGTIPPNSTLVFEIELFGVK